MAWHSARLTLFIDRTASLRYKYAHHSRQLVQSSLAVIGQTVSYVLLCLGQHIYQVVNILRYRASWHPTWCADHGCGVVSATDAAIMPEFSYYLYYQFFNCCVFCISYNLNFF